MTLTPPPPNPPAFPRPFGEQNVDIRANPINEQDGMDLRDYIAIKAMTAIIGHSFDHFDATEVANQSGAYADAMLLEREEAKAKRKYWETVADHYKADPAPITGIDDDPF